MSACSASSSVRPCGVRWARSRWSSRIASTTWGWTRLPGWVPAEAAVWRPLAARSKSVWLICERPALCRQTNSTCAIRSGLLYRTVAADHLVGERARDRADDCTNDVDPEVAPFAGCERGAERACRVHGSARDGSAEQRVAADS